MNAQWTRSYGNCTYDVRIPIVWYFHWIIYYCNGSFIDIGWYLMSGGKNTRKKDDFLKNKIIERMIEIDHIIGRAIINGKPIQLGYYYGRLVELSKQIAFTQKIKNQLPFYNEWNDFRREMTAKYE